MSNTEFNYTPYLEEAFIEPIRTVTVIDDEYPTLDTLLDNKLSEYDKVDTDRLKSVITTCKSDKFNWMLDVYDGKEDVAENSQIANRLHHSDLLILDYHLDGEDEGICERSLALLKHLAENKHFNLVAIHTKGYSGTGGTVNDVFRDVVLSMQKKPDIAALNETLLTKIKDGLQDWEIETGEDVCQKILDSITDLQLLELCKNVGKELIKGKVQSKYLDQFYQIYKGKPAEVNLPVQLLIKWLCCEKFDSCASQFGDKDYNHFDWGMNGDNNWLKTDDLFLTVLGKKETPVSDIPEKILQALSTWMPHPHKLILAKLRYEIERNGISAAQNILHKEYLQAAWLNDLLNSKSSYSIESKTWGIIYKLWEELAVEIKDDVSNFANRLAMDLRKQNAKESVLPMFVAPEVIADGAGQIVHANCFSCTKSIDTYHVSTGHIIEMENNYWLCLTPICDLVPGQKGADYKEGEEPNETDGYMPLTLVQLYDAKSAWKQTRKSMINALGVKEDSLPKLSDTDELGQILTYATRNNLVFVKLDSGSDEISYLSFTVGIDGKANPKSVEYLAGNNGIFDKENKTLELYHTYVNGNDEPIIEKSEAKVIAELRYEYALNLLGRLGFAKARVGLDFLGL
ncbi:response regulator receiver domain [Aestuariibacter sp. AA17]|uniref:Response regulator receiver domain n=1 Tax=Fluctibacter corallii TaxID=2984329 RepID=A0ABT3AB41_9ALTE|nr:response regulator receiver domain [Aestuariibacter sp. AA17]MCV2885893.1 response regulator receiver domain [Aestuariibacter sp. AA17]